MSRLFLKEAVDAMLLLSNSDLKYEDVCNRDGWQDEFTMTTYDLHNFKSLFMRMHKDFYNLDSQMAEVEYDWFIEHYGLRIKD